MSFIESMSAYLKIKKDTVWGGLLLRFTSIAIWQVEAGNKCFSIISASISQTAGNRECVYVKFSLSLASSGNPHYDTLSINRELDQANSINV